MGKLKGIFNKFRNAIIPYKRRRYAKSRITRMARYKFNF